MADEINKLQPLIEQCDDCQCANVEYAKCDDCHGLGFIGHPKNDCPECNGQSVIYAKYKCNRCKLVAPNP